MERERQRARRRLGMRPGEHCTYPDCDEDDPLHLGRPLGALLCYEHQKIQRGESPVEQQHPATRAIERDFTVPMLGNDHRVLTVMSKYWLKILKDPKSKAHTKDAARMSSLFDAIRLMIEKYEMTIADFPLTNLYWDETQPGWRQDFERWLASRERREP